MSRAAFGKFLKTSALSSSRCKVAPPLRLGHVRAACSSSLGARPRLQPGEGRLSSPRGVNPVQNLRSWKAWDRASISSHIRMTSSGRRSWTPRQCYHPSQKNTRYRTTSSRELNNVRTGPIIDNLFLFVGAVFAGSLLVEILWNRLLQPENPVTPEKTCSLVIGLGPGVSGRVDFETPRQTFHRDLYIERGVKESVRCALNETNIEVVIKPEEEENGRVDVEARVWYHAAGFGGDPTTGGPGHKWLQVKLRPDCEQRMEWRWTADGLAQA